MNTNKILAGLGGELVLTIVNESLKKVGNDMPELI